MRWPTSPPTPPWAAIPAPPAPPTSATESIPPRRATPSSVPSPGQQFKASGRPLLFLRVLCVSARDCPFVSRRGAEYTARQSRNQRDIHHGGTETPRRTQSKARPESTEVAEATERSAGAMGLLLFIMQVSTSLLCRGVR